ncbi:MAG TPA: dienelactone hydrolase family protein [Blastocatellia bacterium]|nr:dienelactone hydrolase family protein [Blastocatellia bacterium]
MELLEREISLQTEDGWTIYGTFHLPSGADSERLAPAALLLHGPGHDRDAFASFVYPGMAQLLAMQGIAALRVDLRGRGQSIGEQEYHSFTDEQRAQIPLDVKAALRFLSSQPEIDRDRLAIFAEEVSAEWAVIGSAGNSHVKALAFLSGRLSAQARALLAANRHTPILCVVSKEDRRGFADMAAVYANSDSAESDFRLYEDMGVGTTMFAVWRYRYPDERGVGFLAKQGVDTEKIGLVPKDPGDEKPIEEVICNWIAARLRALGRRREISFQTEDEWTIYGNLLTPENLKDGERAPGVVLLHSGLSDRYIFHNLERLFVKNGMAVLNIDWRGRGKSREKGNYFTLPKDERDRAHLDAKAAVNALAARPEVDPQRIAILGAYIGAKYAVAAALGDPRIGAVVMLSGYIPSGKEREEIAGVAFPILFIGSRGVGAVTGAMADLYELTRDGGSEFIVYDGGALGYQLFEVDEGLEQRIVNWVKRHLAGQQGAQAVSASPAD